MIAYFWTFAKEYNSTQRPDSAQAVEKQIELKQPTDIINPSLLLRGDYDTVLNYCYVPTLHRYYKINSVRWLNGLWEINAMCDVLASWRDDIGTQNLYVLRSSNAWDGNLQDNTYPTTSTITKVSVVGDELWSITDGVLCVGILSGSGGGTTYWLMTSAGLKRLLDFAFSDAYAEGLVGDWVNVFPELKAQTNPLQYITSIMYIPRSSGGTTHEIKLGWVDTGVQAAWAPTAPVTISGTLTAPEHPKAALRGAYMNKAPYAEYTLFVPGFGAMPISASDIFCTAGHTITYNVHMDFVTGHVTMELINAAGVTFSVMSSQVGVPFQVSQVYNKGFGVGGILSSAAAIAGGIASGNIAGAITAGASAIGDVASSQIPSARSVGSNGSKDSLFGNVTLTGSFYDVVDEDLSHRGRPLCQKRTLNTIPGFIMCADADIKIPAMEQEQEQIRTLLEEGVIYV